MTIRMDKLIKTIAKALDIVEGEILGASTNHGKRVAVLSDAMGRNFGMDENDLKNLACCALLHDNALNESILAERIGRRKDPYMRLHCTIGQKNVERLGLKGNIKGIILYHHEWSDGTGPFGKARGEFPLGAELIGIADSIDVAHHLQRISAEELRKLRGRIEEKSGEHYTDRAVNAMLAVLDEKMLVSLRDENIYETVKQSFPKWRVDLEDDSILKLSQLTAHIIDYKSKFTRRHSSGIADKSWVMGEYYKYDKSHKALLYLAAALHDIGKLTTPTAILEKPGKLDEAEFLKIKDHVFQTYQLLKDIHGLEDICNWASNHHEKLDGTGYPFGKKADELDFNSRLLACLDIYQAVSEKRPYHKGRSHEDTMNIMYDMANFGFIDLEITKDLDKVLKGYSNPKGEPEWKRGLCYSPDAVKKENSENICL